MAEAAFIRNDTTDGIVFDVTPAPQSPGYTFKWAFLGLSIFILTLFISFSGKVNFFPAIIGAVVLALSCFPIKKDMDKRKPVRLVAGRGGLTVGDAVYPAANIAELYLRQPETSDRVVFGNSIQVASAQAGAAIDRSHSRRSLSLILRMKENSQAREIVFGLTPDVGMALLNDLGFALGLSRTA